MLRRRMPLVIFFLVTLLLSLGILGMDAFALKSVEITGCERPDEVLALAGIRLGGSIFRVDLNEVEERIESSPYFEVLSSQRNLPSTIAIEVAVREPVAVVHWLDAFQVIDHDGYILDTVATLPDFSCPVVSGVQVDTWETGNRIASVDPRQSDAMSRILTSLVDNRGAGAYISEINLKNPQNITLISPLGMVMNVGDAEKIDRQLRWVDEVLPRLYAMGYTKGSLTLTSPDRSVDFLPFTSAAAMVRPMTEEETVDWGEVPGDPPNDDPADADNGDA